MGNATNADTPAGRVIGLGLSTTLLGVASAGKGLSTLLVSSLYLLLRSRPSAAAAREPLGPGYRWFRSSLALILAEAGKADQRQASDEPHVVSKLRRNDLQTPRLVRVARLREGFARWLD